MQLLVNGLAVLNQILSAGITITAFSLLLYALTFNLRDRVARSFAALLAFVTATFFDEVVGSTFTDPAAAELWLRLQWLGNAFLPVAYLHLSDALLATTGQPSRGRRRLGIRILYLAGGAFLAAALFSDALVRDPAIEAGVARVRAGPLFWLYLVYYAGSLLWASRNFLRAYRRCQTSTTRRRMIYLMISAGGPALGTFPFLLLADRLPARYPVLFWSSAVAVNLAVTSLLLLMAYAVAYFGVTQPDRVIKARLFQWLLRGPVVASSVLAVYFAVNRYGPRFSGYDPRLLPLFIVAATLLLQFFITLVRLPIERALFYGADRGEIRRLQTLEERLLTSGDLRQFLESNLAAVCDALGVAAGFVAAFDPDGRLVYEVSLGPDAPPRSQADLPPLSALRGPAPLARGQSPLAGDEPPAEILPLLPGLFIWGGYWILPLRSRNTGDPLGLLGLPARVPSAQLNPDELTAFHLAAERASAALEDRRLQQEVFRALDRLLPQIDAIQRLRATSAYPGAQPLAAPADVASSPDLAQVVKDALSHYWGGPKLTGSPLLRLRVVEQALRQNPGNPVNALRAVLQQALERLRPEGQRAFTADWLLYNILEMKFLEGRRVRDIAMRLAVSEADLYRKQRVALEELAAAIRQMEQEAAERATDYEAAG